MSLGYVWVKAVDGIFYRGLTYHDVNGNWFLCFDEDEPPELVIKRTCPTSPEDILRELGIVADLRHGPGGSRIFNDKFVKARAFFLKMDCSKPFPKPRPHDKWDAQCNRMIYEGTWYGTT